MTPDCAATHIPLIIGKSAVDNYRIAVVIIYRATMSGCGIEIEKTVHNSRVRTTLIEDSSPIDVGGVIAKNARKKL